MVHDVDGPRQLLHSKEGMTQVYPLAIIDYGIWILPLIRELRAAHPHATQPWCADDSGSGGTFAALQAHLRDLMVRGIPLGYFLELTKIILVISLQNILRAEAYLRVMGVLVITVSRYLGSFIGDTDAEKDWITEKVMGWMKSVMDGVARRYPQTAYTGIQESLQKEWDFVQHITPGFGGGLSYS